MIEMVYKRATCPEVLHHGEYKGYRFFIVSYGTHPCAYVENKKGYHDYGCDELLNIEVHGGITYVGKKCGVSCIGWDYAHAGDYMSCCEHIESMRNEKKWTTEEIYNEVKDVIDQLLEIDKRGVVRK